jgi:voltage-gated potassium channel
MLHAQEPPEELGPFQFGILVLSIVLIIGLAAEIVLDVHPELKRLVFIIDTAVCGLLLIDFCIRFNEAKSKLQFMKWGWIDLIASIPAIDAFRYGRILRVVRVIRLLIAIRSFKRLLNILWQSKTSAGLTGILVISFLVISFGSAGVLMAELNEPNANISSAEDAIWWSITTATTVGYGDKYPVTTAGRVVATGLMIAGISLFGTLSGVTASIFLGDKKDSPASLEAQHLILERLEVMQKEIQHLRTQSKNHPPTPPPPPS